MLKLVSVRHCAQRCFSMRSSVVCWKTRSRRHENAHSDRQTFFCNEPVLLVAPFRFGRKRVLVCAPGDRRGRAQSDPGLPLPRCENTIRSFIMMVTSFGVRDFSSRCDDRAAAPAFGMGVESWILDRRFSLFPGTSLALVAYSLRCRWNSGLCRRVPSGAIRQVDKLPSWNCAVPV